MPVLGTGGLEAFGSFCSRPLHFSSLLFSEFFAMTTICEKCGDVGYLELLVRCCICKISFEHQYCLDEIVVDGKLAQWSCYECQSNQANAVAKVELITNRNELNHIYFKPPRMENGCNTRMNSIEVHSGISCRPCKGKRAKRVARKKFHSSKMNNLHNEFMKSQVEVRTMSTKNGCCGVESPSTSKSGVDELDMACATKEKRSQSEAIAKPIDIGEFQGVKMREAHNSLKEKVGLISSSLSKGDDQNNLKAKGCVHSPSALKKVSSRQTTEKSREGDRTRADLRCENEECQVNEMREDDHPNRLHKSMCNGKKTISVEKKLRFRSDSEPNEGFQHRSMVLSASHAASLQRDALDGAMFCREDVGILQKENGNPLHLPSECVRTENLSRKSARGPIERENQLQSIMQLDQAYSNASMEISAQEKRCLMDTSAKEKGVIGVDQLESSGAQSFEREKQKKLRRLILPMDDEEELDQVEGSGAQTFEHDKQKKHRRLILPMDDDDELDQLKDTPKKRRRFILGGDEDDEAAALILPMDDNDDDEDELDQLKDKPKKRRRFILGGDEDDEAAALILPMDDNDDDEDELDQLKDKPKKRRRFILGGDEDDEAAAHPEVCQASDGDGAKRRQDIDAGVSDSMDIDQNAYSSPRSMFVSEPVDQQQYYCCALPIDEPIWSGAFKIGCKVFIRLAAHLSTKACKRVWDSSRLLQPVVEVMKISRSDAWPKSWEASQPTDDSIGLYFFPHNMKPNEELEQLISEVIESRMVLKIVLDDADLLIFPSVILPKQHHRFQGELYMWGVFKGRQIRCDKSIQVEFPDCSTTNVEEQVQEQFVAGCQDLGQVEGLNDACVVFGTNDVDDGSKLLEKQLLLDCQEPCNLNHGAAGMALRSEDNGEENYFTVVDTRHSTDDGAEDMADVQNPMSGGIDDGEGGGKKLENLMSSDSYSSGGAGVVGNDNREKSVAMDDDEEQALAAKLLLGHSLELHSFQEMDRQKVGCNRSGTETQVGNSRVAFCIDLSDHFVGSPACIEELKECVGHGEAGASTEAPTTKLFGVVVGSTLESQECSSEGVGLQLEPTPEEPTPDNPVIESIKFVPSASDAAADAAAEACLDLFPVQPEGISWKLELESSGREVDLGLRLARSSHGRVEQVLL